MAGTSDHLVKSFDRKLNRLKASLTDMGGIVESQIALAARAIRPRA
jgi:phosphate transport system protein